MNQRPFPQLHRVSPVHQTAVNLHFDAVFAAITPLSLQKFFTSAQYSIVSSVGTTAGLPHHSVSWQCPLSGL
jgi:hypothetical protein